MRSEEEDDDPYDPNAAAELFFAQQKAREEARSKLPTDDWIQLILMMDAKTKMDDNDDDGMDVLLPRLVTTMPSPPLNDSDGMIDLNTTETFISINKAADNEGGDEQIMLNPDEREARRRIMEHLVKQLEEELWPSPTPENGDERG